MPSPRSQLDQLLAAPRPERALPTRGSQPCPCCGLASTRFYRVRSSATRGWGMACVMCAVRVLENSTDAVLGGSACASTVAASSARKRRRRERRAA